MRTPAVRNESIRNLYATWDGDTEVKANSSIQNIENCFEN